MQRIEALYGRLLTALALGACGLLFLMMLMICVDVLLRNVALLPHMRGLAWADEASEYMLYLVTMLAAPWLLREGRHIRVDIVLRALPRRLGWYLEWFSDALAFVCCATMVVYGTKAAYASYASHALTIKTLVTPEWWSLAPLPVAFLLLGIEVLFRMVRLAQGERAPRGDAVAAH